MGGEDQKNDRGIGSGGNEANNDRPMPAQLLSAILSSGNDLASQYLEEIAGSSSMTELFNFTAKLPKLFWRLEDYVGQAAALSDDHCRDAALSDDHYRDIERNFGQTLKSIGAVEAQMKEFLPGRTLQLRRTIEIQMFLRISMWMNHGELGWRSLELITKGTKGMRRQKEGERQQPSAFKRMVQELKMLAQLCFTYIKPRKFRSWLADVLEEVGSGQEFAIAVYQHSYEEASSPTSEDGIDGVRKDLFLEMDLEEGNGADAGVEGQVSERNPIHPPGVTASSRNRKQKRQRKKKNNSKRSKKRRHSRANDKKAEEEEGGSRLIINKSTPAVPRGAGAPNNRTCLLEAILPHIRDTKVKEEVKSSFLAIMPEEGDTSISTANATLARHNMVIRRASERYNCGGSIAFHLLQEYSCSLIIHLRLYDLNDASLFASHFVAWDGKEVHDFPKSVRVNNSTDRTEARCNDVFERLYHKKKFSRWHITSVYELVGNQEK